MKINDITIFIQSNSWLFALVVFITLDVISGVMNAYVTKTLSSTKMKEGLVKKLYIFLIVTFSYIIDFVLSSDIVFKSTIIFYCAEEGLSVLENSKNYIPLPDSLKQALNKMGGNDNGNK